MAQQLFKNNASTTLAVSIVIADTTLTVAGGAGTLFPATSGSNFFYFTIENSAGTIEVCKCTARSTDVFTTIVRAQEGTSAANWTNGARIELRVTAGFLEKLIVEDGTNAMTGALDMGGQNIISAAAITATGLVSAGSTAATTSTTAATLRATSTTDVSLASTLHGLQIGASAGVANLALSGAIIQARSAGSAAALGINTLGGTVTIPTLTTTTLTIGVDVLSEYIADTVGAMVTGNTVTGMAVTYQDSDNTLDFVITDEYIQDVVGAMFTGNTETGITATYQDSDGTVDLAVSATSFTDSEQSVGIGGSTGSRPHGLGAVPSLYEVVMRCKTNDGDWVAGDEVKIEHLKHSTLSIYGTSWVNVTTIGWSIPGSPNIRQKVGASYVSYTAANWRIVCRAFRF